MKLFKYSSNTDEKEKKCKLILNSFVLLFLLQLNHVKLSGKFIFAQKKSFVVSLTIFCYLKVKNFLLVLTTVNVYNKIQNPYT